MMSALETSITNGMTPCGRHCQLSPGAVALEHASLTLAAFLNHPPVSVSSLSPWSNKRRSTAISVLTLVPEGDEDIGNGRPMATCKAVTGFMIAARSNPLLAPVRNVAERPPMKLPLENAAGRRKVVVA